MTGARSIPALSVLLAANAVAWFFPQGFTRTPSSFDPERVPLEINGFRGRDLEIPDSLPPLLGATRIMLRKYLSPEGTEVELFAAFYPRQNLGRQPHDPSECLLGGGWKFTDRRVVRIPVRDPVSGEPIPATELRARQGKWRLAALFFHVGPRKTYADPLAAKVDRLAESIYLLRTDALFVRILVKGRSSADTASLYSFAALTAPHIYRAYEGR